MSSTEYEGISFDKLCIGDRLIRCPNTYWTQKIGRTSVLGSIGTVVGVQFNETEFKIVWDLDSTDEPETWDNNWLINGALARIIEIKEIDDWEDLLTIEA